MAKINDEIEVYRMNEYAGNSSFIAIVDGYLYGLKEYVIYPTIKFIWKCRVPDCPAFIETVSEFNGSSITCVSEERHTHFFNRQEFINLKKVSLKHCAAEFSSSLSSTSSSSLSFASSASTLSGMNLRSVTGRSTTSTKASSSNTRTTGATKRKLPAKNVASKRSRCAEVNINPHVEEESEDDAENMPPLLGPFTPPSSDNEEKSNRKVPAKKKRQVLRSRQVSNVQSPALVAAPKKRGRKKVVARTQSPVDSVVAEPPNKRGRKKQAPRTPSSDTVNKSNVKSPAPVVAPKKRGRKKSVARTLFPVDSVVAEPPNTRGRKKQAPRTPSPDTVNESNIQSPAPEASNKRGRKKAVARNPSTVDSVVAEPPNTRGRKKQAPRSPSPDASTIDEPNVESPAPIVAPKKRGRKKAVARTPSPDTVNESNIQSPAPIVAPKKRGQKKAVACTLSPVHSVVAEPPNTRGRKKQAPRTPSPDAISEPNVESPAPEASNKRGRKKAVARNTSSVDSVVAEPPNERGRKKQAPIITPQSPDIFDDSSANDEDTPASADATLVDDDVTTTPTVTASADATLVEDVTSTLTVPGPSTSSANKFDVFQYDQLDLFGDLENEEERKEEYKPGENYAADIGEVIEDERIQYHITRKMGFGNFSLAWLCYERSENSKKFVALKIYKANNHSTSDEIKNLSRVRNFDHIVQYYRSFQIQRNDFTHDCCTFEPLGSTLLTLLNRANTNMINGQKTGLKIAAIKKITRHILYGLKHLHEDLEFVHTDIKPENILTSVTDRSLFLAVKDVYDKNCVAKGMRATCYLGKDGKPEEFKNGLSNVKKDLEKILEDTPLPLSDEPASHIQNRDTVSDEVCWDVVKFKIIDLGNAVQPTKETVTAGTFEYRAPENIFGAPLAYTFDVWSVGAVIYELATSQQLFETVDKKHDSVDLMRSITRLLGKVPSDVYSKFPDADGILDFRFANETNRAFVTDSNVSFSRKYNIKKLFSRTWFTEEECNEMTEFLSFVFNYDPKKRPTVAQCLQHKWLSRDESSS